MYAQKTVNAKESRLDHIDGPVCKSPLRVPFLRRIKATQDGDLLDADLIP